ncbi:MAG: hypothetical protein U0703_06195 [Anaerolineae bacterium]
MQTRDDPALLQALAHIDHRESALAVTAERAFLAGLGGGCSVPVAAHAVRQQDRLVVRGRVCSPDGTQLIDVTHSAAVTNPNEAVAAGMALAREALAQGAKQLMEQRA